MKRDERVKSKQNDRVTFQVVENASAAHGREAILGMYDVSGVGMNKKKHEFSYNYYAENLTHTTLQDALTIGEGTVHTGSTQSHVYPGMVIQYP